MPQSLGPDLEALVRARPAALREAVAISGHRASRPVRETWRLTFADGTRLKGRRLASAAAARDVEAIVARLDPGRFPRVVARHGVALLEAWVEGETLAGRPADDGLARWAGETLALVHDTPPPDGLAPPAPPAERLARDLRWLVDAGALTEDQRRRLAGRDGPASQSTLVHRDLCPENLVADAAGRLHAVDNAAARLGHPEEDLARTFYRWPMDAACRRALLDAYAARRDPTAFLVGQRFWTAVALAHAARVRLTRGYAEAARTVDLLRQEAPA